MIINCIVDKAFLPLLFTSFQYREMLKNHVNDCLNINDKPMIKMPKKGDMLD